MPESARTSVYAALWLFWGMFRKPTELVPSTVQLLKVPEAGVPSTGVVNTGAVNVLLVRVCVSLVPTTVPVGVVLDVSQAVPVDTAMPAPGYACAVGVEDAQVEPLEVSTLPFEPGATNKGAEVPLPKRTLLAVSVAAPVPPLATGSVPVTLVAKFTKVVDVEPVPPEAMGRAVPSVREPNQLSCVPTSVPLLYTTVRVPAGTATPVKPETFTVTV